MIVNLVENKLYKVHFDRVNHAESLRESVTEQVKAKISGNPKEEQEKGKKGQRPGPPEEVVKESQRKEYQLETNGKSRYGRIRFKTSRYQSGQ